MECAAVAKYWLQDCLQNHPGCPRPSERQWYPTWLLSLTNTHAFLIDSAADSPQGPYATLSHCFGQEPFYVLKEATQCNDTYVKGLFANKLPQALLWSVAPNESELPKKQIWRASSWSWASWDGEIDVAEQDRYFPYRTLCACMVDGLPFHNSTSALHIVGKVLTCRQVNEYLFLEHVNLGRKVLSERLSLGPSGDPEMLHTFGLNNEYYESQIENGMFCLPVLVEGEVLHEESELRRHRHYWLLERITIKTLVLRRLPTGSFQWLACKSFYSRQCMDNVGDRQVWTKDYLDAYNSVPARLIALV